VDLSLRLPVRQIQSHSPDFKLMIIHSLFRSTRFFGRPKHSFRYLLFFRTDFLLKSRLMRMRERFACRFQVRFNLAFAHPALHAFGG
jgi:hypothetical protein